MKDKKSQKEREQSYLFGHLKGKDTLTEELKNIKQGYVHMEECSNMEKITGIHIHRL